MATGYVLLAVRRYAALLIANVGALVASVVLTLVLVPVDHARGAAVAAVVAETCLALGQAVLLSRWQGIRIPMATVPAIALAGFVGASPLLVSGIHPLLRTVAGLALYAVVVTLLGRLPPELGHMLERRRRASSVR